jgi:hypothetical protein
LSIDSSLLGASGSRRMSHPEDPEPYRTRLIEISNTVPAFVPRRFQVIGHAREVEAGHGT